MKKLLLFLLILLPVALHAQVKIGATIGLNISQLTMADNTYKEYVDRVRPGFFVGPTVICQIPKTGLGFDVSALFDFRGACSKNNKYSKSVYCSSFQFPVNVRYGMVFGDMVYGFLFTGPQFGVAVGNRDHLVLAGRGRTTGHAMERRWVDENSTFSWNFGVGGVILETVQVRISYNLPLRKTAAFQQVDLVTGTSRQLTTGKAHALQVSLSYLF